MAALRAPTEPGSHRRQRLGAVPQQANACAARFAGDLTQLGAPALDDAGLAAVDALLRDFYAWEPLVPASASQLADLIAPLCRLLRDDVHDAQPLQSPAMQAVARDWRAYLFPDAGDAELADSLYLSPQPEVYSFRQGRTLCPSWGLEPVA